jgi:hypothetical protein
MWSWQITLNHSVQIKLFPFAAQGAPADVQRGAPCAGDGIMDAASGTFGAFPRITPAPLARAPWQGCRFTLRGGKP